MRKDTTMLTKFKKLRLALDIPAPHVLGHLEYLWNQANIDANPRMSREDVEAHAEWNGIEGEFLGALLMFGWMDECGEYVEIHDYWQHAPNYVKGGAATKSKAKKRKEAQEAKPKAKPIAKSSEPMAKPEAQPTQALGHRVEESRVEDKEEIPSLPFSDPLKKLPILKAEYWSIWTLVDAAHNQKKTPKPESKVDDASRLTLSRLVRIDGYSERDVVDTITWVFTGEEDPTGFWRAVVKSLVRLRSTGKSGITKFEQMHDKWKARNSAPGNGNGNTNNDAMYDRLAANQKMK